MSEGNPDHQNEDPLAVLGPEGERELKRERRMNYWILTAFFIVIFLLFDYLTGNL